MAKHAYLAASASDRWLHCPPSAKLCAEAEDVGSPYAQQGTDAHSLCEHLLLMALGRESKDPTEDLTWYDQEMQDAAEGYRDFVMEQVEDAKQFCPDPMVCVEQTLDFSKWVPHGFGTGDCVIVADDLLHIVDFKYGVGVLVDAADNPQLKCYALGALDTFSDLYDIRRVKLSIYQPRRDNADTWEIGVDDLMVWAEDTLAPIAKLAYDGEGEFAAGDHCMFCKVKATCRKRAEYAMELAAYDFTDAPTLDETEIAAILPQIDALVSWASDIKDYALAQALSGTAYPGFKIVEGRSNRRYTNPEVVASVVEKAGYDPYEKKLLGITAMQRQLGKKQFDSLLGGYIEKPQGKPVLAPVTDTRPEYNTAANDFMEEE